MQQVSLADTLLFEPCPGTGWYFSCSEQALAGKDNLVCLAAETLLRQTSRSLPGVRITLYKNIPVEAGLAGGSSDAAATLVALNDYWQLGVSNAELIKMAATLGSDVPYCLFGGTVLARGRGEQLERLQSLPFFWVVLVLPPALTLSTAAVYRSLELRHAGEPPLDVLLHAIRDGNSDNIVKWFVGGQTNTLETVVLPACDSLRKLKGQLQSLGLHPALSGSGPTLFVLTKEYALARSAALALQQGGNRVYFCWTITGDKEWLDV